MRIYLPRFFVRTLSENLAAMHRDALDAVDAHSDLVLFPEMFLTGYHGKGDPDSIKQQFTEISAAAPNTSFFFGAISEDQHNRLYVYRNGKPIAHYDKVHLFRPNDEHKMWNPGSEYKVVDSGGVRVGLATCNDVRFPEQIRAMKIKYDIQLAIYPALWPWRRDGIWAALLRSRAIENGIFVAGCCIAGMDNGQELFDGAGNHVFDPDGNELTETNRIYELDLELTQNLLVDTREQHVAIESVQLHAADQQ